MNTSRVELINADGTISFIEVQAASASPWMITVIDENSNNRSFIANDLFEALAKWRKEIDAQGGKLLCAGARLDVTPSGMSKSMGGARKAYVIKMGSSATIKVDIFDHAEAEEVATVDEQQRFADQWFASLRAKIET